MFHDTPVNRFVLHGDELLIETEEFAFSFTEIVPPGRIVISGLQSIFCNDVEVAAFSVESDDAEIYGLHALSDGVELQLIWCFWQPKAPQVWCSYRFPGATLHVEALSGGPLVPVLSP